jgi:hypothetical protein
VRIFFNLMVPIAIIFWINFYRFDQSKVQNVLLF